MIEPPFVSIVVNNFNYAHFLEQAIESALRQTYAHREVIVVDDGSTDHSRDVIARFGEQITPIFKQNEGQASTFNAGFKYSKGEIVVFLDADDFLLPQAVERAVELWDDNVVKVHWQLLVVDPQGRNTGQLLKTALIEGDFREEYLRRGPVALSQSPTSGNAWARWFLEKVMPLPEHEDRHGADGFLRKLCPIFGEIRKIEEPQGCYRIHPGNYGGSSLMFKYRRGLRRYPAYCHLLAKHLHDMGIDVDPAKWMGSESQYAWLKNAVVLHDEITDLIPRSEIFILIDHNALGREFFPDRESLPFIERSGEYWGPPKDDRQARLEFERMRGQGASFLVLAFPAFWYLESYQAFFEYIQSNYQCVCRSERLVVFNLQQQVYTAGKVDSALSAARQ